MNLKKLFFTAALLVPAGAYAANHSAGFPDQVAPATPAPIGSNPVVPAAAQAAGFTTLAANYDFTTPFYGMVSNWLDCAGATSPQWYCGGSFGNFFPSKDTIISTDESSQILDLRYETINFGANRCGNGSQACGASITTSPNGGNHRSSGTFPLGMYVELKARVPTQTQTSCPSWQPNCLYAAIWFVDFANSGTEWDLVELYGNKCCDSGTASAHGSEPFAASYWATSKWDPIVYHVYGMRITTDGNSTIGVCYYLDGQPVADHDNGKTCGTIRFNNSSQLSNRPYLLLTIGPQSYTYTCGNGNQSCNTTANDNLYIQYIRIWSCFNWQRKECSGPINP